MILTFTDFGAGSPYLGQMQAVLACEVPQIPVIDLMSDAPAMNPKASAYLLGALAARLPEGAVVLAVVDPGVGSERDALIVEIGDIRYVGPDNGLFEMVIRDALGLTDEPGDYHGHEVKCWRIDWRPQDLSDSFHGRDLFAPVAAQCAIGLKVETTPVEPGALFRPEDWPRDLDEIIYIDTYGNAMTGRRAAQADRGAVIQADGASIRFGRVFAEVQPGQPFWYENALGLVEISVNQGRAADVMNFDIGSPVIWS